MSMSDLSASGQPSVARMPTISRLSRAPSTDDTERGPSVAETVSRPILDKEKVRQRHELEKFRPGWPRFAALQDYHHDAGIYRGFGYPTGRLLLHKQGRIVNILQQLDEYDNSPEANVRGLTAGQTRKVGEPYLPDQLDLLMDELNKELPEYLDLLLRSRNIQSLIAAYPAEVTNLYLHVENEQMLDDTGFLPANAPDDHVHTRPNLAYKGVRPVVFSRLGLRVLGPLLAGRRVSSTAFVRALQALVVSFGVFMLLAPTGFLYLLALSKPASYGLGIGFVVGFSLAFLGGDVAFEHILVGSCAYGAVLVAILMQAQVGGGACCA